MSAAVAIDNLVVSYGAVAAVKGVSLDFAQGEHVTLLGPSGCGKTTTLRAIAGLERASGGRIAIAGTTVSDPSARIDAPPEKRGLSMVFQSYAIWPHLSVFDNVAFPFRVRRIARETARPKVEAALAMVGLAGFAGRAATKLSGGQQQRVALARALAFESKAILFDEPLSNLDAQLRGEMRDELAELRARLGFTAIYVTHDQEEAFALSDRIVLMREGRIEQQGAPADIHAAPRTRFAARFLGMRNIVDAELGPRDADGFVAARLADGTRLRARAIGDIAGAGALAFRPNHVRLGEEGAPATVIRSIFVGHGVQTLLRSGAADIVAEGPLAAPLAPGAALRWSVDPQHCLALGE